MSNPDGRVPITFGGFVNTAQDVARNCILSEFAKELTITQKTIIGGDDFTSPDMEDMTLPQIYGLLLRRMFDKVIEVECIKEYKTGRIDKETGQEEILEVPFGTELEITLIEYYTQRVARKYGIPVDILEGYNLADVELINQALNGKLDDMVFEVNALKLLENDSLKGLVDKYDEIAREEYFDNLVKAGEETKLDPEKENKILAGVLERSDAIQFIKDKTKSFIKYVDLNGEVNLLEIPMDRSVAEAYYRRRIASLKPGEKLDPEHLYAELARYAPKVNLSTTTQVDKGSLSAEQAGKLDFVTTSEKIQERAGDEEMTHSDDMGITVLEKTDEVLFTERTDNGYETSIVGDGVSRVEDGEHVGEQIHDEIISKEKYMELYKKYYEDNEVLTPVELDQLNRGIEYYGRPEKPAVLKPGGSGFALKTFALYFVLLTMFILSIVAIVLYK